MMRAKAALLMLVISAVALWGCAKVPVRGAGESDRIKFLEAKILKLEDDFRTAAAARDQLGRPLDAVNS